MQKLHFVRLSLLALVIGLCANFSLGQTSVFTYQGKLTDMSAAANGQYDFTFRLHDAASGGTQIGTDAFLDNVPVAGGVFTVNLDFGAAAFSNGTERFLEISVRSGTSTGAFTTLAPRQSITSAPFAIQTLKAASTDSLSNSCVLCVTDSQIQSISPNKISGPVSQATFANSAGLANVATFANFADALSGVCSQCVTNGHIQSLDAGKITGVVPGTFKWQTVPELSQQAQPNAGYLTTNNAQVSIALPTAPNIGDVIRISALGTGGWKVTQNPGQSIISTYFGLFGLNWTPHENLRQWVPIASSADGSKLVAAELGGRIYTSTDSGVTWTPRENNRGWWSLASSADGTKLAAGVIGGQIYTSTDSGVTWAPRENNRNWYFIASSADGAKLVAVAQSDQIYTSTDSGVTWIPRDSARVWSSAASSADGTKLVAAVSNGQIYTSTDSGASWTPRESNRNWTSLASSADGTKLAATVNNGQIYTSIDSGISWTPRENNRNWRSVASSADGSKLLALAQGGLIYASTDSGVTWIPRETNRSWRYAALSADGSKAAAIDQTGRIYTSASATTIGASGFLAGERLTSIELQYIGNGQFIPISYIGSIFGN